LINNVGDFFSASNNKITAVCSEKNIDLVKNLGADKVIDYTKIDIENLDQKFDVVYDTVGKANYKNLAKLLKPDGTLLLGLV
jgi:NADPH:quinone reductase-like Zn-dependent oxidoreductase